jgi:dTMP kinase
MSRRGTLIVLEGGEGVGKSTQMRLLTERLARAGVAHLVVREPGGTVVGDAIRDLVLIRQWPLDPRAEALLFMASRAQLVHDVIRPALEDGQLVIADRFFLSTYAYQVGGRGLPEDDIRAANRLATGGLVPDLTVILNLPTEVGLQRVAQRGKQDRIEGSGGEFYRRVGKAFAEFLQPAWQAAHPECGPIVCVDASGTPDVVAGRVYEAVSSRLPELFGGLAGSRA